MENSTGWLDSQLHVITSWGRMGIGAEDNEHSRSQIVLMRTMEDAKNHFAPMN